MEESLGLPGKLFYPFPEEIIKSGLDILAGFTLSTRRNNLNNNIENNFNENLLNSNS